ncbi:alkaline phosphatase family protein [Acidithiobacillus thiooxidans]|uniref:alkaline phosphatase family protein n=1 Tax=Acidithiobacillus thiooxidans TaxID=930 RepID=UPI0029C334B4|nr:alkaline phosphatase family protein [Acidithiobacillus thiooxidans]MDX5936723.1 alkaline phosphatase family protein [Acidithiobacillus thiooxidans]
MIITYGHLSGVRGYNDRFPLALPDGKPIWFQGRMDDPAQPILPFHFNTQKTSAQFLQDLDHSWASQHGAIAGGLMNAWPINKTNLTMGYFERAGSCLSIMPCRMRSPFVITILRL